MFFALIGVNGNLFLIATFGFMMFVFMPAVQIGAEVLIRTNLANEVQGRAFGLISFITQLGYILLIYCPESLLIMFLSRLCEVTVYWR